MVEVVEEVMKDTKLLVKAVFNEDLLPTQALIMEDILFEKHKRIIILSMTRYGKSWLIAMISLLYAIFNDKKKIAIIGPSLDQAKVIMEWISMFILQAPLIAREIEITTTSKSERLRRELTKKRITFRNGSEIRILSAEGKGERLMGFGADFIIEDESALISDEVYRMRITRMLEGEDAIYVGIGNSFPGNHFEDNWKNQDWKKYHIDWRIAVAEGHPKITVKTIEEKRNTLTPMEFQILYDATFPEEAEDALFKWAWIKRAEYETKDINKKEIKKKIIGVDVAEAGLDWTVLTFLLKMNDGSYIVTDIKHWHKADTMETVGKILEHNKEFKTNKINVDAIGCGKGVYDRLREVAKENNFTVDGIKVGNAPSKEKDRFINRKAEYYWRLRTFFEENRVSIPIHRKLKEELRAMKYELTSASKIKIIDPPSKSPDYADSLMLACAEGFVVRILL